VAMIASTLAVSASSSLATQVTGLVVAPLGLATLAFGVAAPSMD
jgi:hypothetical protein